MGIHTQQLGNAFQSEVDFAILDAILKTVGEGTTRSLGHIYNTIGYCNFEQQSSLLYAVNNAQTSSQQARNQFRGMIDDLAIGYSQGSQGGWDHTRDRTGEAAEITLRTVYAKLSQLFKIIENNIMVSIEILLSDLGLIESITELDYNTDENFNYTRWVSNLFLIGDHVLKQFHLFYFLEATLSYCFIRSLRGY